MFHSRGFAPHENQPYAMQARTPGPSGVHLSPTRSMAMTTGKRALGEKLNPFGQDSAALGPKQLFKELAAKTPARALGDRTNKTPGFRNRQQEDDSSSPVKGGGSPSKGKGKMVLQSPSKGSQSVSPKKATAQPLRTLNAGLKENTTTPFSRADQSYVTDMSAMMTPAPNASLLGARRMSRQTSFVTPAANIGKAGQIKARMGEILDAELGLNLGDMDGAQLEQAEQHKELTEEELYPEIEYMPPSTWATNPPYEYPTELDGVPSAKELAKQLAAFRPVGFVKGVPAELSEPEDDPTFGANAPDAGLDLGPKPALSDGDASDDDFWPDVPVPAEAPAKAISTNPASRLAASSASTAGSRASSVRSVARAPSSSTSTRTGAPLTAASTRARPAGSVVSRPSSSVASRPTSVTTSTSAASRTSVSGAVKGAGVPSTTKALPGTATATKGAPVSSNARPLVGSRIARSVAAAAKPQTVAGTASATVRRVPTASASKSSVGPGQARAASLKRSIAAAPPTSVRPPIFPARQTLRPSPSTVSSMSSLSMAAAKPKTQMNPKLRDLENDELGQFVERKLRDAAEEDGFEGFDLGPCPESSDEEAGMSPTGEAAAVNAEHKDAAKTAISTTPSDPMTADAEWSSPVGAPPHSLPLPA